jgi:hypothetical protein
MTVASPAQTGFISTLMAERDYSTLQTANIDAAIERGLTKQEASTLISLLMGCPRVSTKSEKVAAEAGFYILNDTVYRVQPSKSTGNLYAKALVTHEFGKATWEYAQGMVYRLANAEKLTVAQASHMGHAFGVCMVCGRTLTAQESVEAGIGPICAGRL